MRLLQSLEEGLRRSFPSLGLHKGILDSPCLLILLIYTKRKNNNMKFWTDPASSFPWMTQTLPGMFEDMFGYVWRHSPECLATFSGTFGNISRNVWQHSLKYLGIFQGMFQDITRNVWRGMFGDIPQNVWRHSRDITFPY